MSDLIERLRRDDGFGSYDLRKQAADEIERLRAEVERLRPCVHPKAWNQAQDRIAELEAENDKFRQFIDTRIPDQGSQIKRLKADNDRLRAALRQLNIMAKDPKNIRILRQSVMKITKKALKDGDDE